MKKLPNHLRLHTEDGIPVEHPVLEEIAGMDQLCEAFSDATGWHLSVDESPGVRTVSPNELVTTLADVPQPTRLRVHRDREREFDSLDEQLPLSFSRIQNLAEPIMGLIQQLQSTRVALWRREAELATAVPVTRRGDGQDHLAERLHAVLKATIDAVHGDVAALYLLDDDTSQLKMRACFGLPKVKFTESARPLNNALADLEALVGHAVVIENAIELPQWQIPEAGFEAAVCVPVATPTIPLGTLWIYSRDRRTFTEEQTNVIEVGAGRIASDLEREILLRDAHRGTTSQGVQDTARHWQRDRLPQVPPMLDGWEVAGVTKNSDDLGSALHDWQILPNASLAIAVAQAAGSGLESALTASNLFGMLRAESNHSHSPRQMLSRLNDAQWMSSPCELPSYMFYAQIDPETGVMDCAHSTEMGVLLLRDGKVKRISSENPPIGINPDAHFGQRRVSLKPDDLLLVVSPSLIQARQGGAEVKEIISLLRKIGDQSLEDVLPQLKALIDQLENDAPEDRSVLLLRHR